MYFLFAVAFAFHILQISKALFSLVNLMTCIRKTDSFIFAYERRSVSFLRKGTDYRKALKRMLDHTAVIFNYTSSRNLSHNLSDHANYENAKIILGNLLDLKSYKYHDFLRSLNPIHSIRELFLISRKSFARIGVRLNWFGTIAIDVIAAMIVGLVEAHISEIVDFVKMLVDRLVEQVS